MGIFDIFKASKYKFEAEKLKNELSILRTKMNELGVTEYYRIQEIIKSQELKSNDLNVKITECNKKYLELIEQTDKLNKTFASQSKKINRVKELYKSIDYAINNFFNKDISLESLKLTVNDLNEIEAISPSVILKLHCMDMKDLRKAYKENDRQITMLLEQYSSRYTTKANKAIYQLMVIALRAELQNILYDLRYEKLDKSIESIKTITSKYLKIAVDGNQSIAGTITKFVGEIEYLFINAAKIEYNYYVKKEQARQEQLAIRQQMREEAEERKLLEQQQRKIEKEEEKFKTEIEKLNVQMSNASNEEMEKLKARILELQGHLSDVQIKKEEIFKLQNGRAGNVYIISNLGSFGENIFKIGMTRRIDPQERIDELGSASVPFRFDVHSFIFSENAVNLENKLHEILNENRVNKVNLRKEFFSTSVEDLEKIVTQIEPTAEFNKTMMAEEFRQSQSSDGLYTTDYTYSEDTDDDDEE